MFVLYYLIIGSIINIYTMFDEDVWKYYCEFGPLGFVIQLFVSIVFFPVVLYWVIKNN